MRSINGIAYITVKQLLGERLHRSLLIIGLFTLFGIPVVTELSMFNIDKALLLYLMNMFTFLSVLFGIFSVYIVLSRDIGEKKIYYVMSSPVSRKEYLVGRFLGIMYLVLLMYILIAAVYSPFILFYSNFNIHQLCMFFLHVFMVFFETLLIVGVSFILLPLIDSPTVFLFVVTGIYAAGVNMRDAREFLLKYSSTGGGFLKSILDIAYYILPNYSVFDWKLILVNKGISTGSYFLTVLYGMVYTAIAIIISINLFEKKELV